jgi:transposase
MNITGHITELQSLEKEMCNLSKKLKKLRTRKAKIEEEIAEYLRETNKPGIKYKGRAILLKEVDKRTRMPKKEREEEGKNVLEQYGIDNPAEVLNELMEAMKGPKSANYKLQIKKI